jgi:hypothetical protein
MSDRQTPYESRDPNPREERRRQLLEDMCLGTPRAARANRFAHMVEMIMRNFLPDDRTCRRRISDYLLEVGFEANFEIINVPPECDALDKLALERKRLETCIERLPLLPDGLLGGGNERG